MRKTRTGRCRWRRAEIREKAFDRFVVLLASDRKCYYSEKLDYFEIRFRRRSRQPCAVTRRTRFGATRTDRQASNLTTRPASCPQKSSAPVEASTRSMCQNLRLMITGLDWMQRLRLYHRDKGG